MIYEKMIEGQRSRYIINCVIIKYSKDNLAFITNREGQQSNSIAYGAFRSYSFFDKGEIEMCEKMRRMSLFNRKENFPVQEFLFKEYDQLRNEIMTRTGIQHQIISLTLVATGTFIVLESTLVKLFYPILAMFLALTWMQNDIRIGQLGYYIYHKIEPEEAIIGWEHFYRRRPDLAVGGSFAHLASQGILCGTQIFVLLACLLLDRLNQIEMVLFGIDLVIIIITVVIVRPHKLACASGEDEI